MQNIHLVEKSDLYKQIEGSSNEWWSGNWYFGERTAKSLIGGRIFLHRHQKGRSYPGGKIMDCERVGKSRYRLRFSVDRTLDGTMTTDCKKNWARWRLLVPVSAL